jgi:hypothetical protein
VLKCPADDLCVASVFNASDVWIDGFTLRFGPDFKGVMGVNASLILTNCVFDGRGEAVFLRNCRLSAVRNCLFLQSETGIGLVKAHPHIRHNRFEGGEDTEVHIEGENASPYVEGNLFRGGVRAMVFSDKSRPILRSNVLTGATEAGVASEFGAAVIARNNILVEVPCGFYADEGRFVLSHNNLYRTKLPYGVCGEDGEDGPFKPRPGEGELSADPKFLGGGKGDVRLGEDSPCRGTGIRKPVESRDTRTDMGCFPDGKAAVLGPLKLDPARPAPERPEVMAVSCIDEEYMTVRATPCSCGGNFKVGEQALSQVKGRPCDVLSATCKGCGKKKKFKFDISRFFGEQFLSSGKSSGKRK